MVATARNLDPTKLHNLVESEVQGRILWVFGEPVVERPPAQHRARRAAVEPRRLTRLQVASREHH